MAVGTKQADEQAAQDTTAWHMMEAEAVLRHLGVNPHQGMSEAEVQTRLHQYGSNELVERPLKSPLLILWEQLISPLVLLLIGAAVVSAFLGKLDSFIAILAIVILNAALGVMQEYRAERAMAALKKMSAPLVRVRRAGRVLDVPAKDLAPGDIVLLEAGSVVPADARLFETANLRVQEASLTGESQPVEKDPSPLEDSGAPLGDRHNMVFMGTAVTYGRGAAVVVETGMKTQLGRIAELIQTVEAEKTPLQRRLVELGKVLFTASVIVMGLALVVGLLVGDPIVPPPGDQVQDGVLLNAVAIAVAVVPEGLPAVVTIALALGAQRMLRRNALIRKLAAVETLGSVTTICSDKTGTLTENRMTVTIVDVAGRSAQIDEVLKFKMPALVSANGSGPAHSAAQAITLLGGALANDALLERSADNPDELTTVGDPTEGALVIAAARFDLPKTHLDRVFPRVGEVPFESDRKRMTTVHNPDEGAALNDQERFWAQMLAVPRGAYVAFTKGAVDSLLMVTSHVWMDGSVVPLTPELRDRIETANNDLAQNGLRVLGVAYKLMNVLPTRWTVEAVEHDLVFVGMVGIIDPPRKEVKDAVAICKRAGIRPMMITGDHPLTALAIARELGIAREGDKALTGHDLARMTPEQLSHAVNVEKISVYARVSPEHKLNIVQALQAHGEVAAMTGDGVNDAPALKRANIGVAMGITGTAVSKEASDMVLIDDNFATIVAAVEEGRTIYDNVRRFIKYLLASNTGELIVLLLTQLVSGMTIPLTTLQILWMNLITDGIPALALGVEQSEKGGMNRPPYAPNESLFGRGLGRHILIVGTLLGGTGLLLGIWAFNNHLNGVPTYQANTWNTMVFIFLTIAQMGHALGLRSHRESVFTLPFLGNKLLIGAIVLTVVVQMIAIYTPFFNHIFNTTPLTPEQLTICLVLSTIVFVGVELEKFAMRRGWLK